jgi:hypothetical protein
MERSSDSALLNYWLGLSFRVDGDAALLQGATTVCAFLLPALASFCVPAASDRAVRAFLGVLIGGSWLVRSLARLARS